MDTAVVGIGKDEAVETLRGSVARLISILEGVRDPGARAVGSWTIRDVAAHLGDVFVTHGALLEGKPVPAASVDQIANANQEMIDANPEHDIGHLAARVKDTADAYLAKLAAVEGDPVVTWVQHDVPLSAVIAADIGECLVHGHDISAAEGRVVRLDPRAAALAVKGVSPMTVHYVDEAAARDLKARFRVKMREQYQIDLAFDSGKLSIEEPSGSADVHISADPEAFMLVGYGRSGLLGPVLRGKIVAYGRRPWLALRFGSLLKNP